MNQINVFLAIFAFTLISLPFLNVNWKGIVVFTGIVLNAILSTSFVISALFGQPLELMLKGSLVFGEVRIFVDAVSAWFIIIINFIFITGTFYALFYMKAYRNQKNNIFLHSAAFLFLYSALITLCVVQNSIVFLIAWEIMAISAFVVVIFEHEKMTTLNSGINYLIQSHISIVILMFGFIWVANKTGSYDFQAITSYTSQNSNATGILLFLIFFIGFAIKAGFVPFHTWLPYAHPAAPSHISGIMSGVMIKIGIFGILRMISLIKTDYYTIGLVILVFSIVSGLYGVMLAIVQHNLKKLLAYHSIENIGIIGIGIGVGCIGLGTNNNLLATFGFAGGLLHVWNHALFKSLLFFTAGNVYQSTHTMSIEHMGGLGKKMPQTAFLFLIAAIAISGIPPFNGFISEFLIYSGLYVWMQGSLLGQLMAIIFSVLALVLIGGLAMLCFTKAFGIVFLGSPRQNFHHEVKEVPFLQLLPLYIIAFFIVIIGVFPQIFTNILSQPVRSIINLPQVSDSAFQLQIQETLQPVSFAVWGFILIIGVVFGLRKILQTNKISAIDQTWGCGYVAPTEKQQYTASSFVRSYSKLFKPFLLSSKNQKEPEGIFPGESNYETHIHDRIEKYLIDIPVSGYKWFLGRFVILQNGKLQFYIAYGIIFITLITIVPIFYDQIMVFIEFLKQL